MVFLAFGLFLTEVLLIHKIILASVVNNIVVQHLYIAALDFGQKAFAMTECPTSLPWSWLIKGLITNKHFWKA